jgi:hypothetical protein
MAHPLEDAVGHLTGRNFRGYRPGDTELSSVLQCVVNCLQLYRTRVRILCVPLWASLSVRNEHVVFFW